MTSSAVGWSHNIIWMPSSPFLSFTNNISTLSPTRLLRNLSSWHWLRGSCSTDHHHHKPYLYTRMHTRHCKTRAKYCERREWSSLVCWLFSWLWTGPYSQPTKLTVQHHSSYSTHHYSSPVWHFLELSWSLYIDCSALTTDWRLSRPSLNISPHTSHQQRSKVMQTARQATADW